MKNTTKKLVNDLTAVSFSVKTQEHILLNVFGTNEEGYTVIREVDISNDQSVLDDLIETYHTNLNAEIVKKIYLGQPVYSNLKDMTKDEMVEFLQEVIYFFDLKNDKLKDMLQNCQF